MRTGFGPRLAYERRANRFRNLATYACVELMLAVGPVMAQEAGFHPVDSTLEMMDMKTETKAMPDFVQQSRPKEDVDYLPVGTKHTTRAEKLKTPSEIKAAEAELDAAHDAQLAGHRPTPSVAAPNRTKGAMKIKPAVATNR